MLPQRGEGPTTFPLVGKQLPSPASQGTTVEGKNDPQLSNQSCLLRLLPLSFVKMATPLRLTFGWAFSISFVDD